MLRTALSFFLLLGTSAYASNCVLPAKAMARTELFFGAGKVSDAQWKRFLAREVTPRFPDGLTALDAYGQWKAPDGRIAKERSRVLILLHDKNATSDKRIEEVRATYKRQFHQLSVMRVDGEDCVSF